MTEVLRQGSGKKVLLLHGWGCSCDTLASLVSGLSALGFEAIAPSFPGFGKTLEPDAPWGVEQYSLWTLDFIRENGLEGCPVVAHSFGARVTLWLAARYPELFQKIILTGGAGLRPKRTLKYYIKVYCYKLGKRMARVRALNKLFGLDAKMKRAGSEDYRALSGVMKRTFVMIVNEDLSPCLPRISNPTLLIWGSEDKDTPLYMAKRMEREIEDAGLVVFEGAGHYCFLDEYGRFMAVLKSFLEVIA